VHYGSWAIVGYSFAISELCGIVTFPPTDMATRHYSTLNFGLECKVNQDSMISKVAR